MDILERSKNHRTWDWRPSFFIGFNYFYFSKDNFKASQELMQASEISGAPVALSTWASRLASKAGQYQTAIDFLEATYENTEDEKQKRLLRDRINAIKGAYHLQQAVEQFKEKIGRFPETLDELTDHHIIPQLPQNPYNRPYSLSNGRIDF